MSIPPNVFLGVAVTSWLVPGAASYNAEFLASRPSLEEGGCRIIEMGICCFSCDDSLSYAKEDWPSPSAPFMFHVHLPLDLPWCDETRSPGVLAGERAVELMRILKGLGVQRGVLHPPAGAGTDVALRRIEGFLKVWREAGYQARDLLLENDRALEWPVWERLVQDGKTGFCLDAAHLMAYSQERLLGKLPVERVRLVHWSAPGIVPGRDSHRALTDLSPSQMETARRVARAFPDALPLAEVFSWEDARLSMPVLRGLYLP